MRWGRKQSTHPALTLLSYSIADRISSNCARPHALVSGLLRNKRERVPRDGRIGVALPPAQEYHEQVQSSDVRRQTDHVQSAIWNDAFQRGARARGSIGVPRRLWHEQNADAENERPDKANADDGAPRSRARDLSRSDRYAVYIEAPVSGVCLSPNRRLLQATRIPKVMNSLDRASW